MHENFSREETIEGSSDRAFGVVMAAFFLVVGLFPLIFRSYLDIRWWSIAIGVVFAALAWLRPRMLNPLNRLWLRLGLLLSKIVSPLVLALLYYATVTPIGLLMRAAGKDPLRTRRDPSAQSHWISREPPGPAPDTMRNQF
ncbi:MAG: SxtJ family membrane protein [Pseudorhodoplanes sp.]|uniref:SxtJ family membrane protein n=1 Tax=Pseudorhodoplanes sp. TaxID=1934341 RepID=UPI003D11048A